MEETAESYSYNDGGYATRLIDIESRQKLIRDRMLLIGENLVETKEELTTDMIELKKDVEELKSDIKKIKQLIERLSEDRILFARKTELEVLKKQAQMFQPLELATKEYVEEKLK